MLNPQGYVAECTGDNIFYIKDGAIFTPPSDAGILEGVTREAVMDICRDQMKLPVVEKTVTLFDLYRADEIFLTGTGAEVIPACKLDGHTIGSGQMGPITRKVIGLFREHARSTGTPIYEAEKVK